MNHNDSTYMAALVFPDAIRKYSGARQYSYFVVLMQKVYKKIII